jgi:hypothetical protein
MMVASLLLTVALAVALGLIIYLSVTSLPYLAVSPTTDENFGALNACVLEKLRERTGFAVAPDGRRLVAWSSQSLVDCSATTTNAALESVAGLTAGAFDGHGGLWLAHEGSEAGFPGVTHHPRAGAPREVPNVSAQALVGTSDGVIVLEPSGLLVSLGETGDVRGSYQLPVSDVRGAVLSSSFDGEQVAVVFNAAVFVFTAQLKLLRAQAPCEVQRAWWAAHAHRLILECSTSLALTLEVDTGRSEAAPQRQRVPSVLLGPAPVWVQVCDVLPCTAPTPE